MQIGILKMNAEILSTDFKHTGRIPDPPFSM